jgi:carbamoyltransferase
MPTKEIILGINWEQNSTASLMIDNEIVGCSSEERFSKVKNDERYPINAINWLLKEFNVSALEITSVCFISKVWSPIYILARHYTNFSMDDYLLEQKKYWYPKIYLNKKISYLKLFKKKIDYKQFPGPNYWNKIVKKLESADYHVSNKKIISYGQQIRKEVVVKHLNIDPKLIEFIDHSFGHACYAYFGLKKINKEALVLTLDAFGDYINYSAHKFIKRKKKLIIKKIISGPNFIIGRLYRYITLILGLKPNEHEYKVMGLAPYCKKQYFQDILEKFTQFQFIKKKKFVDNKRPKDLFFGVKELIDGKRFDAISGALQKFTENLIESWVINLNPKKEQPICIAGGVSLNVKSNYNLSKKYKNIFVPASPDDSSQAMGACFAKSSLSLSNNLKKTNYPKVLNNAYLGYKISSKEALEAMSKYNIQKNFKVRNKDANFLAAKALSKGKVVARAVGRAEFGARSLGNRSILANPSIMETKEVINEKIKNRDFWMPFAASVLEKYARDYFIIKGDFEKYKYMTNCADSTDIGKDKLKAALHPYDLTCRPQILTQGINPQYEDLIKRFGKITNTYGLLNTSFNLHGLPIVNNSYDVLDVFLKTKLDCLILDKYFIEKNE